MAQSCTGLFGGGSTARPLHALAIAGVMVFLGGCKHAGSLRQTSQVKDSSQTLSQLLSGPHTTQYDIRSGGGSAELVALEVGGTPSLADLNANLAAMLASRLGARESEAMITEAVDNGTMARGLRLGLQTLAPRVEASGDQQLFWQTTAARQANQDIASSLQTFLAVKGADGSPSQVTAQELQELNGKLLAYAAGAAGDAPAINSVVVSNFFSNTLNTKVPRAAFEYLIPFLVQVVDAKKLSLILGDEKSSSTARVLNNLLVSLRLTAAASADGVMPNDKTALIKRLRTMLGPTFADIQRIVAAEQYIINVRVSRADLRSRRSTQVEDYFITQNKLAAANQTAPAELSYIARTIPKSDDALTAGTLVRFYATPLPSLLSNAATMASFSAEGNEVKDAATAAKKISRLIELMQMFGSAYQPIIDYLTAAQRAVAESRGNLGIAAMDVRSEPLSAEGDAVDADSTGDGGAADSPDRSGSDASSPGGDADSGGARGAEGGKR